MMYMLHKGAISKLYNRVLFFFHVSEAMEFIVMFKKNVLKT